MVANATKIRLVATRTTLRDLAMFPGDDVSEAEKLRRQLHVPGGKLAGRVTAGAGSISKKRNSPRGLDVCVLSM